MILIIQNCMYVLDPALGALKWDYAHLMKLFWFIWANNLMKLENKTKHGTNLYKLALLLAQAQSRKSENRGENFIDNLARICDQFSKSKP